MSLLQTRFALTFLICLLTHSLIVVHCFRCEKGFHKLPWSAFRRTMADSTEENAFGSSLSGTASRNIENQKSAERDTTEVSALEPPSKRIKLLPTRRRLPSTSPWNTEDNARQQIQQYTASMNERVKTMEPFTKDEICTIIHSLQNVIPIGDANTTDGMPDTSFIEPMLSELQDSYLPSYAHLSHKNWTTTGNNAERLNQLLFPATPSMVQRHMFERIYREGNWDEAAFRARTATNKPWAVLVTGVNGIRKTTSIYQPWFPSLLHEALQPPPDHSKDEEALNLSDLPCGSNTFFRQLDHMIATLCNEEFIRLYAFAKGMLQENSSSDGTASTNTESTLSVPTPDIVQLYSNMKAAIFARYRTVSELLGVVLLREAQNVRLNCMLETSGRDVAMFHYIDHFFSKDKYHKLALHFIINDLEYAKTSVDQRMIKEIQTGIAALDNQNIFDIIDANAGGPYGSEVLSGIQADSDRVWKEDVVAANGVGQDWYKATIQINAHATEPWTAQAVKPDGSLGTEFPFEQRD